MYFGLAIFATPEMISSPTMVGNTRAATIERKLGRKGSTDRRCQ